jgi:pimeloyl-ACP methyl ester carboxylesterase
MVDGYPMVYQEKGSGPTVVLVHGVLTDYRVWGRAVNDLSAGHHAVAVSLRHFYPEPWDGRGGDFTVTQHATDLIGFIQAMHKPVDLVGWSYGAHVAFEAARLRPDLVRRLVLAEAPLDSLVSANTDVANQMQRDRARETAGRFKAGDIDGGLRYAIDAINGPGTWDRAPPQAKAAIRDNAWTVVGIGMQEPRRVTCRDFGSLRMPVLLLTGEFTTARFKAIVAKEAECLPAAIVETIPRSGHAMPLMNPLGFDAAVKGFLDEGP